MKICLKICKCFILLIYVTGFKTAKTRIQTIYCICKISEVNNWNYLSAPSVSLYPGNVTRLTSVNLFLCLSLGLRDDSLEFFKSRGIAHVFLVGTHLYPVIS